MNNFEYLQDRCFLKIKLKITKDYLDYLNSINKERKQQLYYYISLLTITILFVAFFTTGFIPAKSFYLMLIFIALTVLTIRNFIRIIKNIVEIRTMLDILDDKLVKTYDKKLKIMSKIFELDKKFAREAMKKMGIKNVGTQK